jgi:hypothetical protein
VASDGALFVSDDGNGTIWRIDHDIPTNDLATIVGYAFPAG